MKLCDCDDISEGQSKSLAIGNDQYFAVRRDQQLYVYKNHCPHLGIRLEWQADQFLDAEGELIQCATHGALFLIETGECVAGPCQGKFLSAVEIKIEQNKVYLKV